MNSLQNKLGSTQKTAAEHKKWSETTAALQDATKHTGQMFNHFLMKDMDWWIESFMFDVIKCLLY